MPEMRRFLFLLATASLIASVAHAEAAKSGQVENVIFMMADGLRWQEVFKGADESLLSKEKMDMARIRFQRGTPEESREALMPFLWQTIAKQGQIFGNIDKGSSAQITNVHWFSYPGYSETLCGFADERVDSNDKIPNPNVTVLEWLNGMSRFKGKVAAFGAWDLFPYIINRKRSGVFINAGYEPMEGVKMTPAYEVLNRLKKETIRYWEGEPFDSLTLETALEYMKTKKPRVLFISLGETDEWPHGGQYGLYLQSAYLSDYAVKTVWQTAQSMPRYRGKTMLIFSADHGRGNAPDEWKSHGSKVVNSNNIWMAFMGPGTPALGERAQVEKVTADRIAATLAAALGQDYCAAVSRAGKPITDVLKQAGK